MDGFVSNEGGHPDRRHQPSGRGSIRHWSAPGRFDREIVVGNPDIVGREHILKVHVRKVPLAPERGSQGPWRAARPGFSGADLMKSGQTRPHCSPARRQAESDGRDAGVPRTPRTR